VGFGVLIGSGVLVGSRIDWDAQPIKQEKTRKNEVSIKYFFITATLL